MFKKIILSILLLVLLIAIIFVLTQSRQKAIIRNELSDRSKEFIKSQQSAAESSLKNLNFNGPVGEDTRGKRVGKDKCFSFIIPFRVTLGQYEEQQGSECYMRLSFDSPKGAIVAYKVVKPMKSWEDIPAVIQRRRDTDEYFPEEVKNLGGKEFMQFRGMSDSYEKNSFYFTNDYFIVFNLITRTNENLDKEMDSMLATLEIE